MLIQLLRMAEVFLFPWHLHPVVTPSPPDSSGYCLYPFFVFSSLATISPSSCLLPFQSFNPLFLRPFFLFLWIPVLVSFAHLLHLSCISSSFPLCIRPWPRPPNARVNIIMCMPFLCSSYIREKHVLQHPYNSTL